MARQALVFGLMLLVGACQAARQERAPDAPGGDTASDVQQRPAVAPGPAPGMARVRAAVQACRQHAADDYRCRIEVREVVAYGAATPVLDVGSDVEVRVLAGGMGEQWPEGHEIEVTLSHAKQPAPRGTSTPVWVLKAVHGE